MNAEDPAGAVSELLRIAAAGHEPDRDRVVRRLGFEPASGTGPVRLRSVPRWAPGAPRRARMLPVGVAAAAAVVVTGVALLVTTTGNHPVAAPDPATLTGAPTTTSAASGAVIPTSPAVTSSALPPVSAPSLSPVPPPARTTGPSSPVITASTAAVPDGTAVVLGDDREWAAVVRPDGTVVHPKTPRLGPLDVRWTGAVAGAASPYRVSWSGGSPEQDRDGATTWLAIGGGSVTVTVPALPRPATVALYLGARGADVVVSGAVRASWSHQAGDVGAVVVTIAVPASTSPVTFTVTAARVAPGGTVGLAAVTLT